MYISDSLQIAALAQNMLSPLAAGDASQTTPVQTMHVLCCVVLHKLSLCNFDSCSICVEQHNLYWRSLASSYHQEP